MNLRRKMVLTLGVIAFIGISGMWIFTDLTLSAGFEVIEAYTMESSVLWGVDDIYDFALIMDSATAPIAAWDDLYNYMDTRDPGFIEEVFSNTVLEHNKFNLVAIYSNIGELVYGKYYQYVTNTESSLPQVFTEYSTYQELVKYDPEMGSVIGVINDQDRILIIASRPILDTSETAPSRGTLVLGFEFSEEETTQIQELTVLPLEYYSADSPALPVGLESELSVESPFTYRITQDQITGYYMLEDIFGDPAIIVALVQPREVYQAGQEIRNNFLTIILGIGFFLGTVAIIYADRTILKRVTYLSDEISEIAEIDDLSARVKGSEESDEIGVLSKRINEMLTRLDESRKDEQSQREKGIKEIFVAAKKISFLVNTELERPLHSMKQVAYDLRNENNRDLADILENSIKYTESTLIELSSLSNLGEPKRTVSDLNEVIEAAIANVEPKVGVSVESVTDEAFLAINIDAVKVARAFENIIRNAVEAIETSGFVKVSVSVDDENAIVTVTDNGVGIPKNQIDYIFEPFYSTKKDTMGLGLVYAKQVIEAHGGSITVESTEGVGTKVTVTIPLIQPNE